MRSSVAWVGGVVAALYLLTRRSRGPRASGPYEPWGDAYHVEVGHGKSVDIDQLLDAISVLPTPATIFVEGTSMSAEVRAFLATHAQEPGRNDLSGIIAPRPEQFHLPLSAPVIDGLRELGNHYAEPEMFDHLLVYNDIDVLLGAYDFGLDPIWIRRTLPEDVRDTIAAIVD